MDRIETSLQTQHGGFRIVCYDNGTSTPDFAIVHGHVVEEDRVLVRVQSECLTGHVFQSLSCDCYEQLQDSLALITAERSGVLIYLRQEGRGVGLANKLRSYVLQKQGADTVDANLRLGLQADGRSYDGAAEILADLQVVSVRLLTNNPDKVKGLTQRGTAVVGVVPLPPVVRDENRRYLNTKQTRMGHTFGVST